MRPFLRLRTPVALALCAALLVGCGTGKTGGATTDPAQRSEEMTAGQFPETMPPNPTSPPPPSLTSPKSAVLSYLLWISLAYRILDSTVAEPAMSVWQEVRVNSYVELNRQEKRAIDQRLVKLDIGDIRTQGTTATVDAHEVWRYRYIDFKSGQYKSAPYTAEYRTEYTVLNTPGKGWLVDKVRVVSTEGAVK